MQLGRTLQNERFIFSLFDWLYIYINTVMYVLQPNFKALTVCKPFNWIISFSNKLYPSWLYTHNQKVGQEPSLHSQ